MTRTPPVACLTYLALFLSGCVSPPGSSGTSGPVGVPQPPPLVADGASVTDYTFVMIALGTAATGVVMIVLGARGRGFTLMLTAIGVAVMPHLSAEIMEAVRTPLMVGAWMALAAGAFWLGQRVYERWRAWRDGQELCEHGHVDAAAAIIISHNPAKYNTPKKRKKLRQKLEKKWSAIRESANRETDERVGGWRDLAGRGIDLSAYAGTEKEV